MWLALNSKVGVFFLRRDSHQKNQVHRLRGRADQDSADCVLRISPTPTTTMAPFSGDGVLWLCLGMVTFS